jgi:Tfp pilus assembly protein PilP
MKHMLVAAVCLAVMPGWAQQPPVEKPAAPAAQAPTAQAPAPAAPASAYTYRADGRRDPFVSLVGRGADPKSAANRPPGLPGMLINEVSLKGILYSTQREEFQAMLQGTDKKTYTVRAGQRLLDGSIKSITADTVVFSQDVNDPLSLVKQREVRKTLRSGEEIRG